MLKIPLLLFCLLSASSLFSQDLPIADGWKFSTGDQPEWASPSFNDSAWARIKVGASWESQGYTAYNGFAWYRLHVRVPSGIKDKAFLKEKLRLELGKIDDGDEVYLNGYLI